MVIGEKIREVVREKGMTVVEFADAVHCSRETAHRLFHRDDISILLLKRISKVLDHDFLKDLEGGP